MEDIIKLLEQIDDDHIKEGFTSCHYDIESCIIELLYKLGIHGCEASTNLQKDAIVVYLVRS